MIPSAVTPGWVTQPDNLLHKFNIDSGSHRNLRRASSLPEFPDHGFNPGLHVRSGRFCGRFFVFGKLNPPDVPSGVLHIQHGHGHRRKKAPRAAAARIQQQRPASVLFDPVGSILVGMSIQHHVIPAQVSGKIPAPVRHGEPKPEQFELQRGLQPFRPTEIVIPTDRPDRRNPGQCVQDLLPADIPAVEYRVTSLQDGDHLRPEQVMGIRNNADLFLHCRSFHPVILRIPFTCFHSPGSHNAAS